MIERKPTETFLVYMAMQQENPDTIVFKQLGDFYEVLGGYAPLVAHALDLILTKRDCGLPERTEMCGFPVQKANEYFGKLSSIGYKYIII